MKQHTARAKHLARWRLSGILVVRFRWCVSRGRWGVGFFKRIRGGKEDKEDRGTRGRSGQAVPADRKRGAPDAAAPAAPPAAPVPPGTGGPREAKQWIRALGQPSAERRAEAAEALKRIADRSAIRPLIVAYLNYGDAAVIDALRSFGGAVSAAASGEAHDTSNVGERRARLMDILGATGDETVASLVRDEVGSNNIDIHVRACVALARLGDTAGIDSLEADLQQVAKDSLRSAALKGLAEVRDVPQASRAIEAHVNRYLGQAGAIPDKIQVSAPRLDKPDVSMTGYIISEIVRTDNDLLVVIGSGATEIARSRQSDLRRGLPDHRIYFLTPQLAADEQMNALEEARDLAASKPEHTVLAIGQLPAPGDNPPLRHFLAPRGGKEFSCKIIIVDPHEYGLLMDWWHYIEDKAEVPTKFEVVLSASTPDRSATSDEEYLIYELIPPERRQVFAKALLAHF
jgi:hypothetical protein